MNEDNIGASYAEMSFEEEWADHGEDMPEDTSDLFQAMLEVRVRYDVFVDLLANALHGIRETLNESTDVPGRAALTKVENLIRVLESDEDE